MAEIKVGLTQFLDFTLKSSAAKTNFVKNLKFSTGIPTSF